MYITGESQATLNQYVIANNHARSYNIIKKLHLFQTTTSYDIIKTYIHINQNPKTYSIQYGCVSKYKTPHINLSLIKLCTKITICLGLLEHHFGFENNTCS